MIKPILAKPQAPTLEDVARRAQVSTATVSRCLNQSGSVRPATRERVEQAVAELGYTPHYSARALASNRSNTVGVVIPTMENAIFARGLQAMEEALSERDVTLLVATSDYRPERELQKIRALVARGVDGLGLIGFERPPEAYDFLATRGAKFVLLWSYLADSPHPCVGFDNHHAAMKMARRILAAGHRRIAMIAGRAQSNDRAAARIHGAREALAEQGLAFAPGFLVECAYSFPEAEAAAHSLLKAPERPTALICGNDVLAVGALRAARAAGLRVPEDVSIIGFDDIDLAAVVDPPLTTVRVPHRRMGRAAAEMLLSFSASQPAETHVLFDTEIIERGSIAPPCGGLIYVEGD